MSFRVNVAHLLKGPVGYSQNYPVSSEDGSIGGELKVIRTSRSLLVAGHLDAVTSSQCSRCLKEFELTLGLNPEEEFFPTVDVATGQPLPHPEDPEAFTIDENQTLDMEEMVRQYSLLAMPLKPLCRPECQGLCPRCGADLNTGSCSCPPQADFRWEKLQELLSPSTSHNRKD